MRVGVVDEDEFDAHLPQGMPEQGHDDYYAKIRAEVGYDDDAFESDAESGHPV